MHASGFDINLDFDRMAGVRIGKLVDSKCCACFKSRLDVLRKAVAWRTFEAFDLPLPPAKAWALLMDIPRVAPCMPGELSNSILPPASVAAANQFRRADPVPNPTRTGE